MLLALKAGRGRDPVGLAGPGGIELTALSLGLIIGGAFGNAIDRLAYGAVVDFVLFHIDTASFSLPGTSLTSPMPPSLPG